MNPISTFHKMGLPEAFGNVLLVFCLILVIAPYAAGADFGVFKIPAFSTYGKSRLKIAGPVFLILLILLFLPIWPISTGEDIALKSPF